MAARNKTVVETRPRRAKRARAEAAEPPDALSGTATAHTNNWRDWANLTDGPAGLITEKLLADDVAGYLRFRAVCGSWRLCTTSPNGHTGLDSRFHPRRWIMLPEVFAAEINRRDFLNISTGERIQVDLPNPRYQFVIGPTSEGLILLCGKRTGKVHLLNPLTQQLTALPNATSLLYPPECPSINKWKQSTGLKKLMRLQGFSAGLADSSTVAVHFDDHEIELAVAKLNDKRWSSRARPCSITGPLHWMMAPLSFADRFYCFTRYGMKAVDATDAGQRAQLVGVINGERDFWSHPQDVSLVDNNGELILLSPSGRSNTPPYDVHLVDLDAREMLRVHSLRGRAVFLCDSGADCGRSRSLSVPAGLSSSIKADTIYRCRSESDEMVDGRTRIDVFLVPAGRWIEHDFVPPDSIVEYLSRYVCRSPDIVVPAPLHRSVRSAAGLWKRKPNPKVVENEWVN